MSENASVDDKKATVTDRKVDNKKASVDAKKAVAERQGQIENKKTILMQMYAYKLSQLQSTDKGRGGIGDIRKGAIQLRRT